MAPGRGRRAIFELAVIGANETHALVFPCRRVLGGWMNAKTNERVSHINALARVPSALFSLTLALVAKKAGQSGLGVFVSSSLTGRRSSGGSQFPACGKANDRGTIV
jgi:hypothetical protein